MQVHYYNKSTKRNTAIQQFKRGKAYAIARYFTAFVALVIVYLFIVVITV